MKTTSSSSLSGSRFYSSGSAALLSVKQQLREMPLGRRMCSVALVINEDDVSSPSASSCCLVKSKTELALLPMKKEHEAMATDEETALKMGAGKLQTDEDRRWNRRRERRLNIDEMDEHAMEAWHRQFPEDVFDERQFFA
ncbi:Farnesyl pyrophosphate synthetase [Hordeum vulgare]|nr:Farnesyl pyrophosphate synthetase [Hordeum vulgare]